jgi:hypothetical protein
LPAQGVVALFPEKRIIHHGRVDWMMRHPVGEATTEREHLCSDAALSYPSVSRKIIGSDL